MAWVQWPISLRQHVAAAAAVGQVAAIILFQITDTASQCALARILLSRDSGRGLGGLLAAHRTQHANAIMWPINKIEGKQTDRKTSDLPTFNHLKLVQQILVLDILEG